MGPSPLAGQPAGLGRSRCPTRAGTGFVCLGWQGVVEAQCPLHPPRTTATDRAPQRLRCARFEPLRSLAAHGTTVRDDLHGRLWMPAAQQGGVLLDALAVAATADRRLEALVGRDDGRCAGRDAVQADVPDGHHAQDTPATLGRGPPPGRGSTARPSDEGSDGRRGTRRFKSGGCKKPLRLVAAYPAQRASPYVTLG
jgi:hypothetical protein